MQLRGDEVLFYGRGEDRVAVWRLRFEPDVLPEDAIAEIEADADGRFVVREEGGDVLVFAGEPASARDELAAGFALP